MITEEVIKELFKNYKRPPKDKSELRLQYFADLLQPFHDLEVREDEVVVNSLEEYSPFRRFLIRSINAILEFDKIVAFVFSNHILFFSTISDQLNVSLKPQSTSIFDRIFGRDD